MLNNRQRLFSELKLLIEKSDQSHPLKEEDIENELGLNANRKTIYEDIKTLIDNDFDIVYNPSKRGYYLSQSPFSLAEIKILVDSINDLKGYADKGKTIEKLYNFVSIYQQETLKQNAIYGKYKENNLRIETVETILNAIQNKQNIEITYNKKERTVSPYFLHFSNGKYYLYVTFDSSSTYSYRLDRLTKIKIADSSYIFNQSVLETILNKIKTSLDNFDKNKAEVIKLEVSDYENIRNRLNDDFPDHYFDNKGNLIVEYRPNEIFFSKIVAYGNTLKIKAPSEILEAFLQYLNSIVNLY